MMNEQTQPRQKAVKGNLRPFETTVHFIITYKSAFMLMSWSYEKFS